MSHLKGAQDERLSTIIQDTCFHVFFGSSLGWRFRKKRDTIWVGKRPHLNDHFVHLTDEWKQVEGISDVNHEMDSTFLFSVSHLIFHVASHVVYHSHRTHTHTFVDKGVRFNPHT